MAAPTPHRVHEPDRSGPRWNFAAALATWLVPGLGHMLLGQVKRGVILLVTIALVWTAGLGIGGISVIDAHGQTAWFLCQMFVSPSVAADQVHRQLRGGGEPPLPASDSVTGQPPPYEPAFGRVQEQGTLYTSLAGLLNLLAILDVVYRDPSPRPGVDDDGDDGDAPASPAALSVAPVWLAPALIGYRPFLDPLPLERGWFIFLVPLAIAIAVVYKTIKLEDLRQLPRQAAWLSFQIVAFMVLAAAALWLVTELV